MTDQENKDLGTSEQEHSGIAESPARGGGGGQGEGLLTGCWGMGRAGRTQPSARAALRHRNSSVIQIIGFCSQEGQLSRPHTLDSLEVDE